MTCGKTGWVRGKDGTKNEINVHVHVPCTNVGGGELTPWMVCMLVNLGEASHIEPYCSNTHTPFQYTDLTLTHGFNGNGTGEVNVRHSNGYGNDGTVGVAVRHSNVDIDLGEPLDP